jgi:hypothetical protein
VKIEVKLDVEHEAQRSAILEVLIQLFTCARAVIFMRSTSLAEGARGTGSSKVDDEFVDLQVYSTYKAIHELLGKRSWDVVWRSGEILFMQLREKLDIEGRSPIETLKILAEYLRRVGYVERIEVEQTSVDEIIYTMSSPIIFAGAKRLIEEGAAPPHFSTSLMFAALKIMFGIRAHVAGEPIFQDSGDVVERWKISRGGQR